MRYKFLISIMAGMMAVALWTTHQGQAQNPESYPIFLVSGVDFSGQGYPLTLINPNDGTARTLATFSQPSTCTPPVFPTGQTVLYELPDPDQPTIYAINTTSGERIPLLTTATTPWYCPQISPSGNTIAWLQMNGQDPAAPIELIITDSTGNNPIIQTATADMSNVQWSPAEQVLVYSSTGPNQPFPRLYSIPVRSMTSPYLFWDAHQGIVLDYTWIPDSSGLLIAYTTDNEVGLTLFPLACVIGTQTNCPIEPITTFPSDTYLDLFGVFSPLNTQTIIGIGFPTEDNTPTGLELWKINLRSGSIPELITQSPQLLKTSVYWSKDGENIYFIGSQFDEQVAILRGGLYVVPMDGSQAPQLLYNSDAFSPATILWVYE